MPRPTAVLAVALAIAAAAPSCSTTRPVPDEGHEPARTTPRVLSPEEGRREVQAIAPKLFPRVPPPDAAAAEVPAGYRVEVAARDLTYPTSVELDGEGNLYIAEAGFSYGDPVGDARVLRLAPDGRFATVADQLRGPVTDLLWHDGKLYVAHLGTISTIDPRDGARRDIVTDLPVSWDHQNDQLAAGKDGKIYCGIGSATNAGVVGLDNIYPFLWLLFWPDLCDVPARDVELEGVTYTTPDALTVLARQGELVSFAAAAKHLASPSEPLLVKTGAYQPFGKAAERVSGRVKASSAILRMNADGSGLEVYAWGVRNPFGLRFGPDGVLYASDNGYDERGSRPIANAPDCIWAIKQGAYYGFPDYAAGIPVTDARFRSQRGPAPAFLLKNHPPVEAPVLTTPHHAAATKFDFSRSAAFGFEGQMFLAEFGSGNPINAPGNEHAGHAVVRIDLRTKEATTFLRARPERLGPAGYEHVATPGPKRPIEARFSPDGSALYVVDFGGLATFPAGGGPLGRPFPGSGAIWRITREGTAVKGPTNASPLPPPVGQQAQQGQQGR